MSARLVAQFDGLSALVPKKPVSDTTPPEEWLAVLPDVRQTFLPTNGIKKPLAPHIPCVVVPDEAVVDIWSDKRPSLVFRSQRFDDRVYRLYVFEHEKLELVYEKSTLSFDWTDFADAGKAEPANATEEKDLGWVAPLEHMGLQEAGKFQRSLIDANDVPLPVGTEPVRLAGTVKIDGGRLETDGVVHRGSSILHFDFKPDSTTTPALSRAQVDHVVWSDDVHGEALYLKFSKLASSQRTVKLKPVDDEFPMWIFNLELETVLGVGFGYNPNAKSDSDFAIFYALSAGWPFSSAPLPVPHPVGGGHLGGSREPCKPSTFEGW